MSIELCGGNVNMKTLFIIIQKSRKESNDKYKMIIYPLQK